jgi:2-keto-3-deoxy-L-rhamnonate aldolase RhmA
MKRQRSLQERLSTSRAIFGLLQTQPNTVLAELAGMCGYDFLLLDGEHGVFSERDYLHTMQVLSAVDVLSMVRLPRFDLQAVGRYLDIGADAIVVPNVSTVDQATALVRAMEYPPSGTRGCGAGVHRVTRYAMDMAAHMKSPRESAWLIVMIESALGVANVEEIVAIEGVDGILIGPVDLSAELGCPGDFSQAPYAQAMARIERAASETGKLVGTVPHQGHSLEALLARGHRLFIVGADMPLIREAMVAQVQTARSCL